MKKLFSVIIVCLGVLSGNKLNAMNCPMRNLFSNPNLMFFYDSAINVSTIDQTIIVFGRCYIDHDLTFKAHGVLVLSSDAELIVHANGTEITFNGMKKDSLIFNDKSAQISIINGILTFTFVEDGWFDVGKLSVLPSTRFHIISHNPAFDRFFSKQFILDIQRDALAYWDPLPSQAHQLTTPQKTECMDHH
jgi:hypothetical protein